MQRTDVVVIGAGQAGLAASRCLDDAGIDHVVLERGRIGERWRSERWDSLRLLTPNWATRLPGRAYAGSDPDGFMRALELVSYFEAYADSFAAPVRCGVTVRSVEAAAGGFVVHSDDDTWYANDVVVAVGWADRPRVPRWAKELDTGIGQFTPSAYRNPSQLPRGGVLVVGASASGVQLADELARAGREVVLAVGGHARVPRRYRGVDIFWWLDQIGVLAETIDQADDPRRAPLQGSLQLIGRSDGRDVDLPSLQRVGVRLAGRLLHAGAWSASFADDLVDTTTAAQRRLEGLLARIDRYVEEHDLGSELLAAEPVDAVRVGRPLERLDLRAAGITSVLWATGYTRRYDWLRVPVLDAAGEIVQARGVTPHPGLYVLGQRFQHRRDSNFIDGVRHDAAYVVGHISARRDVHAFSIPSPRTRASDVSRCPA